jgi:glutamate/tyrosine decarboxylase-like PLP-dependent enzyme
MKYANTKDASYVAGEDYTMIGSRSGANAIAVWMILVTYGRYGWEEKMLVLMKRTSWLVEQLDELKIRYYRNPCSNIVTIRSEFVTPEIAEEFGLVPDDHNNPNWYKVVLMPHVTIEKLIPLVEKLKK